jgi:hypothetical protein
MMAKGVAELKRDLSEQARLTELPEIHQFLDGFYLSRIGIRILIGQHIALHEPPKANHIGLICTRCSPVQVRRWRLPPRMPAVRRWPLTASRLLHAPCHVALPSRCCSCSYAMHMQRCLPALTWPASRPASEQRAPWPLPHVQVAQDAINDARSICMREYGDAPDVSIYGHPSFTFAYVPSHLHHMVFELVKNSLRAVQDR